MAARRTALLLGALALAGAAGAQDAGQRVAIPTQVTAPAGDSLVRARPVPEDWREDPDKNRYVWETMLGGEEYRRALQLTGMAEHLARAQAGQAGPDGPTSWTRSGPTGALGSGGENGRVAGLQAVRIGSTNWIYAGASSGGLWRSDMASIGAWQGLGAGLGNPAVRAFAVHPTNPQRIVVGTGDPERYKGGGMFLTTDGGASWQSVALSVTPTTFYRIVQAASAPTVLVAASDNGLWRSTTSGDSWTMVEPGHWTDVVLHPTNTSIMYAVRRGVGVHKSTTQGGGWTLLSSPNLPATADWQRSCLAICRDYPDTVALVVVKNNNVHGVYRTMTGGTSWSDITSDLKGSGTFGGGQAHHALALSFRPNNRDEILVGAADIARSYWDSGTSQIKWRVGATASGIVIGHADITQLYFTPLNGDDLVWISNDGGLYFHHFQIGATLGANGNTSTGLALSQIDHLDANRTMAVIGLQDNGVIRSTDSTSSWTQLVGMDGGGVQITDPEHFDFWFWWGMPWDPVRSVFGQSLYFPPDPGLVINLHHDPVGGKIWVAGGKTIYSSGPYASPVSWTIEHSGGSHPAADHGIRRLWGSKLESGTLFLSYGYSYDGDITVARKQGSTWSFNTTSLLPQGQFGWIDSVTPSSEWPGECWVGCNAPAGQPKIFHTTDYGATWEDLSGTLASVGSVYRVIPEPFNPLTLYVATDVGLFRSLDGGQSWLIYQTGMPIVAVRDMAFVVNDAKGATHRLRAATYGLGTWERDVVTSPIVYVDKAYIGAEDGSFEHPYNTVAEAVAAAPAGAIVAIRSNTYDEPQVVTKNVKLMTYRGTTVIR